MIGNKITGIWIFDKNRNICSEQEFYEWEDLLETKKVDEIKKNDLIVGNEYKLENGDTGVYLGFKYMSKVNYKDISVQNVSKISKKHFFFFTNKEWIIELQFLDIYLVKLLRSMK